jgi:uncharacterized membrane protein SpoIIM required for sporulation
MVKTSFDVPIGTSLCYDAEMAQSIQNFIRLRKPRWDRLEQLIRALERGDLKNRTSWNPLELAGLYREAAADLARLQSFRSKGALPEDLETYLNQLVGRAYGQIYRAPPPRMSALWEFLRSTFPAVFLKTVPWTLTAFGIFFVCALYGFVVTLTDDSFIPLIVSPKLIREVEEGKVWFDSIVAVSPLASSRIMTNNISVCFLSFALGITCGLGTVYIMASNGLMLGALAGLCHIHGLDTPFWSFVLPHGVIELTAIFISGGAGLLIGTALLFPGDRTRKDALARQGREAGRLVIGCVPLLVVAGVIEGFVSPTMIPATVKYSLAGFLFLILLAYLVSPFFTKDPGALPPGTASWPLKRAFREGGP